jgi:hypothetical protein
MYLQDNERKEDVTILRNYNVNFITILE